MVQATGYRAVLPAPFYGSVWLLGRYCETLMFMGFGGASICEASHEASMHRVTVVP